MPDILNAPAIALRCHLTIRKLDDQWVLVIGENEHYLLSGRIYGHLSPLLQQGGYSADQMASALGNEFAPVQVYHALSRLDTLGVLTTSIGGDFKKAFWDALGATPDSLSQKLGSDPVAIVALHAPTASVAVLQTALESLGIEVVPEAEAEFVIAITDHYLSPSLEAFAQRMQQTAKSWTVVKPGGHCLWLGPIMRADSQSCWACLLHRLRSNREIDHAFQLSFGQLPDYSQPSLAITHALAMNLIALEVAKLRVLGHSQCLENHILTLDLLSLETQFHPLPRRPQCPECGLSVASVGSDQPFHAPLPLLSRPKLFNTDGGYRTCERETTLERLNPLLSPITGIIPEIKKIPGEFSVYLAKQTIPVNENSTLMQALSRREGAAGKGMTDTQARVSCLAEAVERYSTCFQGDEPQLIASYREVADRAIHPNDLLLYSQTQLEQRQTWNQQHSPEFWVSVAFDETIPIAWTACWSLSQQVSKLVPTAYCYFNSCLPQNQQFVITDTNGCAAGNTLEEAVLQGLLELVERDAVAIWWFNRVQRPGIAIKTFASPFFERTYQQYRQMNRHLTLLDITNDLAIPVVVAVSWQEDGKGIRVGLGAHLEAEIAASRAITELSQLIAQERALIEQNQDPYRTNQRYAQWSDIQIDEQRYLMPLENTCKTAADFPAITHQDLKDDIQTCLDKVISYGIEVLALDLTRPDIGFPTVRMITPGLRHLKPRFAPGRLYDVPIAMNWLEQKLAETDLNPFPFYC